MTSDAVSKPLNSEVPNLVSNALINVSCRLIVIFFGVVSSVITARWLGAEGRGIYFTCITISAVVAQFSTFGLTTSNTFIAAQNPQSTWPLLINSIVVSIIVYLTLICIVITWGEFFQNYFGLTSAFLWCIVTLAPAVLLFNLGTGLLIANERYLAFNLLSIINSSLVILGMFAVIFIYPEPLTFVLVTCISALISTFAVIAIQWPVNRPIIPSISLFINGINMSGKAYIALVLGYIIPKVGVFFITKSHGPQELGVYSVAVQLFDVTVLIPTSLAMVLFPRLLKPGVDRWSTTIKILGIAVGFISIISFIVIIFGRWLIYILFGTEFINSYEILIAMLPAAIFYTTISIVSQFIVSDGFPINLVILWILGFLAVLISATLFIPVHGGIGAAWSQSIALFIVAVGSIFLAFRINRRSV